MEPPVNRMIDRCKKITFPQLRLWALIILKNCIYLSDMPELLIMKNQSLILLGEGKAEAAQLLS